MRGSYKTNVETKKQIDKILFKTVQMMANVGMKTSLDVGDRKTAKKLEKEWLQEIKDLDPEMYELLVPTVGE
jgi:hypothetical protein